MEHNDDITPGRIVHFVLDQGSPGSCRPAIVVANFAHGVPNATLNMVVFTDGLNDGDYGAHAVHEHLPKDRSVILNREMAADEGFATAAGVPVAGPARPYRALRLTVWETSVVCSLGVKLPRSWHWPRSCSKLVEPQWDVVDGRRTAHQHGPGLVDPNNCYACRRLAAIRAGEVSGA